MLVKILSELCLTTRIQDRNFEVIVFTARWPLIRGYSCYVENLQIKLEFQNA